MSCIYRLGIWFKRKKCVLKHVYYILSNKHKLGAMNDIFLYNRLNYCKYDVKYVTEGGIYESH